MKERWLGVGCMDGSSVLIRSYKKHWCSRWVIDKYTWVECEDGTKRRLIDIKKEEPRCPVAGNRFNNKELLKDA